METPKDNLAKLLDARAHIDEELRRHKSTVTVIFTDVIGSTAYFDRYGDTAGVAMMHRHAEAAGTVFKASSGRIIKTIGDSVMAEFPTPLDAVRGAIELQSRVLLLNTTLPKRDQLQLRIGIDCGPGFRQDDDPYGDAVNVAARITKHTARLKSSSRAACTKAFAATPPLSREEGSRLLQKHDRCRAPL
jgi:class 3 adenylate cyclase